MLVNDMYSFTMKLLFMLLVCTFARGNPSGPDLVQLPNIMTDEFKADPVKDMKIGMLKVDVDHPPGDQYYLLVLKANQAVKNGYIKRNWETKKKGAKGIYTELYNVVGDREQVLLPSVDDLQTAEDYFSKEHGENKGKITRKEHLPRTKTKNYQVERFTEDEKENILERLIEEQDKERTGSLKNEKSKHRQKSDLTNYENNPHFQKETARENRMSGNIEYSSGEE